MTVLDSNTDFLITPPEILGDGQESITDFQKGAVLLIDKPVDWSSFDVVKKIRNLLCHKLEIKKLKVGHAGTLDPLATGLMIICTGKATKQIDSYQGMTKEYEASFRLGHTTPSFDLETEVDNLYPTDHISPELISQTIHGFIGESDQVPPVFSAKRMGGKRAYEYARQGKEIELRPARITIHEMQMLDFRDNILRLRILCSKGTYIRALARDMGAALDSGACLIELRRTAIGQFSVKEAVLPKKFEEMLNIM
ncbi:MAG TPA: tRNA pseudouridine(55) synthase TruB [Bacteroides sp.]|nr:tRNA pseudouridine(55) synthase TruB [Bacteroides sp.]